MDTKSAELRTYFLTRAPKSVEIVETFIQNGAETMDDLCEKGNAWFIITLGMDEKKIDTAQKIVGEYRTVRRRVDLLAAGEVLLGAYFYENTPDDYRVSGLLDSTIDQLTRAGIESMGALDAMTDEKIKRIRNIGHKRRELVLLMRDKYRVENTNI